MTKTVLLTVFVLLTGLVSAQEPVLDMHLHALPVSFGGPVPTAQCVSAAIPQAGDTRQPYAATWQKHLTTPACSAPVWSPASDSEVMRETVEAIEKLNVIGVVSGSPERVQQYTQASPQRFYPGIHFELGVKEKTYSLEDLRKLHARGQLSVFGEIANQYQGIEPGDARMAPYWALAEELDLPVAIHVGTGPPGSPYLGFTNYRARLHSALTLEEVLVKHPKLRVQVMHAGYPMLDDLLAVLYAHPQVYVDVGVIVWVLPRKEFYRYLETIVNAGYGSRVMFGSDQMVWPGVIEHSINIIKEAPFLSGKQKRNILYNNAARFLRLSDAEIKRHHEMGKQ